jgi:hypothetical protein
MTAEIIALSDDRRRPEPTFMAYEREYARFQPWICKEASWIG